MTIKSCIKSMRLRTLPLSLAGVAMGVFIAASTHEIKVETVVLLILTTCLLQILSNLSNELGDSLSGTDNAEGRQGMHYSVMDGEMTMPQLKRLIVSIIVLCCVCGTQMVHSAFGSLWRIEAGGFLLLGACAIGAAMRYTLGKSPYGYRGLGDIFVFIFFGLVSTIGSFCICTLDFRNAWTALLPACAIGCFSMGVLNVNNIRDMKTDAATRKTVALRLGIRKARIYQTGLIVAGLALMVVNNIRIQAGWWFLTTLPLFALHLKGIWTLEDRKLDPMLPLLVMSTFILSILAGMGMLI